MALNQKPHNPMTGINQEQGMSAELLIAVFVDFENLAIGVRDMKSGDFKMRLVLKRLLEPRKTKKKG